MKSIETVEMKVSDIKNGFGNPRKISKKKREELIQSLETFGNFGLIVIDENDDAIAGNQRVEILTERDPDTVVLCKRLVGYSTSEKKAINIKDNTHSGEWDLDILADWTAALQVDLGLDLAIAGDPEERTIEEMELIHYERYDYLMIVCKDELSYNSLIRAMGLEKTNVFIGRKKRRIKARAIWYDEMPVELVPKEQVNPS